MKNIKKAEIQINKGEFGWKLILKKGDKEILEDMYGGNYESLSEECKCFTSKTESMEGAVAKLYEYAKDNDFENFIITKDIIIASKNIQPKPVHFTVDLRWSLWSTNKDEWVDENDKNIYSNMKNAFEDLGPECIIHTAPYKEIRFGTVRIIKGSAHVYFYTVWDSPCCHVPDNCPNEFKEEFSELISQEFEYGDGFQDGDINYPIGAEIEYFKVEADSFENLMIKITQIEDELVKIEKINYDYFCKWRNIQLEWYKGFKDGTKWFISKKEYNELDELFQEKYAKCDLCYNYFYKKNNQAGHFDDKHNIFVCNFCEMER